MTSSATFPTKIVRRSLCSEVSFGGVYLVCACLPFPLECPPVKDSWIKCEGSPSKSDLSGSEACLSTVSSACTAELEDSGRFVLGSSVALVLCDLVSEVFFDTLFEEACMDYH